MRDRIHFIPELGRRQLRAVVAGAALLAAAGCEGPSPTASLFPLEGGHRWVYDVRTQWESSTSERESRIITSEGESAFDGGTAWRRRSADGVDWFLRVDDTGVYRVGTKTDLDAEPTKDPQRRYVLKAPLRNGTTWQAFTPPYLLKRRQEFPPEIRHSHAPVLMTYAIETMEAKVEVPAGKFDNCLQVRGQAVIRLFADPTSGWKDLPLTTQEWYCRGPGLVKLVREEPANSSFLVGGQLTMELTEWK